MHSYTQACALYYGSSNLVLKRNYGMLHVCSHAVYPKDPNLLPGDHDSEERHYKIPPLSQL